MTPLAHRIVKDLTLPEHKRQFRDTCDIRSQMQQAHYFDLTGVDEMVQDVRRMIAASPQTPVRHAITALGSRAFLPAATTWLEFMVQGHRAGYLLQAHGASAQFYCAQEFPEGPAGSLYVGRIPIENLDEIPLLAGNIDNRYVAGDLSRIYAALAIINTPRLIGRRQHMPHRGLERRLLGSKATSGFYPLRAWTELTLSISALMTEADGTVHEAHLTGERCLHFCRAHLRVRNGQLEQVKAHWRGNPALGVKRTRYRVVP